MSLVTDIIPQKRNPERRNVYLDGKFAFACHLNVIARFRLHDGMKLTPEQRREIERGEVKQECFDRALEFLRQRLHSRAELYRKLTRREWGEGVVEHVLDELARLGYLDDERYARTKALSAAQHKHHGRRRAFVELIRNGVNGDIAGRAVADVYTKEDSMNIARQLAQKHAPRLRQLAPAVARRRLAALLQRRGFDYESIKPVIDEVLR